MTTMGEKSPRGPVIQGLIRAKLEVVQVLSMNMVGSFGMRSPLLLGSGICIGRILLSSLRCFQLSDLATQPSIASRKAVS